MTYIKKEPVTIVKLVCDHPLVDKIWEWGGSSMNPTSEMLHYVSLLLKNGERKDFKSDITPAVDKAELFLETLEEK